MSDSPIETKQKSVPAAAGAAPSGERKKKKKKKASSAPPTGPSRPAASKAAPLKAAAPEQKGPPIAAIVAVGVVGAVAIGWWALSRNKTDFAVGKEVDVEVTVVAADKANLSCAAAAEAAGRSCAFETPEKPRAGAPTPDDPMLLMPYTTVDKRQILAGGLWAEGAMKGQLPAERFTVKCKFKVEAIVDKPSVRWVPGAQWFASEGPWPAGVLSGCTRSPG